MIINFYESHVLNILDNKSKNLIGKINFEDTIEFLELTSNFIIIYEVCLSVAYIKVY
jgi:hypothetical protein